MDNHGDMNDYEKEEMRSVSEITKGIVSNPSVQISILNDQLMFSVGGDWKNVATIFKNAIEGVRSGVMATK